MIKRIYPQIQGEIESGEDVLEEYSRDWSIFKINPSAVAFPKNSSDICTLVNWASLENKNGHRVSLTGRSAGTDMTGGPLNESLIVSFSRYTNKIISIGDKEATVQPGCYFRDFDKATLRKNLIYPAYPASRDLCALGGIVNNNSAGEKTLKYGKADKWVKSLRVVLSDGNEYEFRGFSGKDLEAVMARGDLFGRVHREIFRICTENKELLEKAKPKTTKNSAGYALWDVWDGRTLNLSKLIIGAQGTLGLVTEATLGLIIPPKHSRLAVIFMSDMKEIAKVVDICMKFKPESLESYDDSTLKVAMRYAPEMLSVIGAKNIVKLAYDFMPEIWRVIRHGMPKIVLLCEVAGEDEEEIKSDLDRLKANLSGEGFEVRLAATEEEAKKYWAIRRHSFALLTRHAGERKTAPFIDDVAVPYENLYQYLPALEETLKPYRKFFVYTVAGHVGDGNFHIIPLANLSDPKVRALIPRICEEVYRLTVEHGGTITAEHNDGLIRTPFLNIQYLPEVINLFEEVKRLFDPLSIFNPGKKVHGDIAYAMSHIK